MIPYSKQMICSSLNNEFHLYYPNGKTLDKFINRKIIYVLECSVERIKLKRIVEATGEEKERMKDELTNEIIDKIYKRMEEVKWHGK